MSKELYSYKGGSLMTIAKLTSKGQITIPKEVREKLGLAPGDRLEFIEEGGRFVLQKKLLQSPFVRYMGYLQYKKGEDPDEVVKELRGHS
jgi:AbrB family looped-hinge helix DNA binding protein